MNHGAMLLDEGNILLAKAPPPRNAPSGETAYETWRVKCRTYCKGNAERIAVIDQLVRYTAPNMRRMMALMAAAVSEDAPLRSDEGVARESVDVAIVCALHDPELTKVLSAGQWDKLPADVRDPQTYYRSETTILGELKINIVTAAPNYMGLSSSAVLAAKMIWRFRPRLVVLCGIAAGARSDKQGFGDILVAEHTFDYGAGRMSQTDKGVEFAPDPKPLDIHPRLLARLREWARERRSLDAIQGAWPAKRPRTRLEMWIGPLGSGAAVVDTRAPIDATLLHWRKLVGIEMEAFGVHAACRNTAQPEPMFMCLKSICDFANDKDDDWQEYAAFTSATLCRNFLVEEWHNLFPE